MNTIGQRWQEMRHELPTDVELVAVSKFHPVEALKSAYDAGCRIFGESRAQEMCAKHDTLPQDITWHFIGHLQPNKVKYIAPFVSLIHAVDTPKLLAEISKRGVQNGRSIPCLLQVHVAKEETKFGFTPDELLAYLSQEEWRNLQGVEIAGLMCMASNTDNMTQVADEFKLVRDLFFEIKSTHFPTSDTFHLRSYGMTHDWKTAVECGSNMVRIGTRIFGEREY